MVNKEKILKENKNIWRGNFKEKELKLYESLKEQDIKTILDYQKLLPCLQDDNSIWIDGRTLHTQMKSSKAFSTWIKTNLENIDAMNNEDYIENWIDDKGVSFKGSLENTKVTSLTGRGYKLEYKLKLETAKQIAMIAGANPRANQDLKEISKIARKYFIAIEKAFKERVNWNKDRMETILKYYNLREIVFNDFYKENKLGEYIPEWWSQKVNGKKNPYSYELYLLDLVIIKMSSKRYREINNIPKGTPIRNTFNEEQLEDFDMLQSKSAEYMIVNNVWNTNERFELLKKFYTYYKEQIA